MVILENIDIDIDTDIDMVILENIDIDIDIDKAILQNIDIDKISNRIKFGISNRANQDRTATTLQSVAIVWTTVQESVP